MLNLRALEKNDRKDFLPNLKGLAQNLSLSHPFEVLDFFGGKSKFFALQPSNLAESRILIRFLKLLLRKSKLKILSF